MNRLVIVEELEKRYVRTQAPGASQEVAGSGGGIRLREKHLGVVPCLPGAADIRTNYF